MHNNLLVYYAYSYSRLVICTTVIYSYHYNSSREYE